MTDQERVERLASHLVEIGVTDDREFARELAWIRRARYISEDTRDLLMFMALRQGTSFRLAELTHDGVTAAIDEYHAIHRAIALAATPAAGSA